MVAMGISGKSGGSVLDRALAVSCLINLSLNHPTFASTIDTGL
jgi:hypothetical protein